MPKRLPQCLAVLVLTSSSVAAQTVSIDHSAVGCVIAGKYPRLEARVAPEGAVARARVLFRTGDGKQWYAVAMKPEGAAFAGVLPKPKKSLKAYRYYIEVTDKALGTSRTAEYTTNVVGGPAACKDKMMGGALGSASVTLEVPAGAPSVPAGFSSSGLVAAGVAGAAVATGAAVAAAAGGGGISTAVLIGVAGVAAAGAGVAVAVGAGGGEGSSSSRTAYRGSFSQQWTRTQVTVPPASASSTCIFTKTLSGTVTITLEQASGSVTGRAETTVAEAEVGRTPGNLCSNSSPGTPPSSNSAVTGSPAHLTFKFGNNNNGGPAVEHDFSGALSGGVITGTLTFTETGVVISPSGSPGTTVTHSGSVTIPITLQ